MGEEYNIYSDESCYLEHDDQPIMLKRQRPPFWGGPQAPSTSIGRWVSFYNNLPIPEKYSSLFLLSAEGAQI